MEVGQRKKIRDLWKQGLASEGEDRAAVHICREKTRKAKAQLELTLATVVSDNKKGFFKYVQSKRRSNENTVLILGDNGHLTNKEEKIAEHLMYFLFVCLFQYLTVTHLWLSEAQSWRTMTGGALTSISGNQNCKGIAAWGTVRRDDKAICLVIFFLQLFTIYLFIYSEVT